MESSDGRQRFSGDSVVSFSAAGSESVRGWASDIVNENKMNRETAIHENGNNCDHRSDQNKANGVLIYFLLVALDEKYTDLRIKIGKSRDFNKRKREHEASKLGVRVYIEPLCVVAGKASDEKQCKRYFQFCRWDGEEEVFRPDERLISYIRWLRDQYFVWVPERDDEEYTEIDGVDHIDGALWLPEESRVKKPSPSILPGMYGPLNLSPRELTQDDFYTNERILQPVRELFGGSIDLDPASHASANKVVQAKKFFTRADDGLSRQWAGKVWLNPPFSHWDEWAPKTVAEWKSGRIEAMCVLAACRTLTAKQFSPVVTSASAICILYGRIPFWGQNATSSPDDGHVIFYFGKDVEKFARGMTELGTTFKA
jgi:hypothetical protein